MRVMVSLVGEQPAPNLLPIRHCEPDLVILLETRVTERVGERLQALMEDKGYRTHRAMVDGYRIPVTEGQLEALLEEHVDREATLLLNLTGGTKPMALATYRVAAARRGEVMYLGSEAGRTVLYRYGWCGEELELARVEEIAAVITLDEYLRAYQGRYTTNAPKEPFERAVVEALHNADAVDEVMSGVRFVATPAVEIDFALRMGNRIGIGEVKRTAAKKGIDQLVAVTEQRALGTYVARFLVSGHEVHPHNRQLAAAHGIRVIELVDEGRGSDLDQPDASKLLEAVMTAMAGGRAT